MKTKTTKKEALIVESAKTLEAAHHEVELSRNDENGKKKLADTATDRRKKAEKHLAEVKESHQNIVKGIE
jgi:hypothetical protein